MAGQTSSRSGFTMVELLVGMLAASVLALTCALILEHGFRALSANGDAIELQRDVDIATRTLYRQIRNMRSSQIDRAHLAVGGESSRLTFGNSSFYRGNTGLLYDVTGSHLVYDPNTSSGGDEQVLIEGTLQALTFFDNTDSRAHLTSDGLMGTGRR